MASDDEGEEELDQQQEFKAIGSKKCMMTPEELCCSPDSRKLLPFVKEIYSLSYGSEPDYSKLNFMLVKELMAMNLSPTKEFDWNRNAFLIMKQ